MAESRDGLEILAPNGRRIERPDDLALPHVLSFASILQSGYKTYFRERWDEAIRNSRENALAMKQDVFIQGIVNERVRGVTKKKWHLEVDDERDPWQKMARDQVTAAVKRTPHLRRLIRYCYQSQLWHGRGAAQVRWKWRDLPDASGKKIRSLCVQRHVPVNGDKINHLWDGTPTVAVYGASDEELGPAAPLLQDNLGRSLALRGPWRERFLVGYYDPEDADFFDAQRAEAIHGVGLRDRLYWAWWLRDEYLSQVVTALERFGLGVVLVTYPDGNAEAKTAAENLAKSWGNRTVVTMPRPATGNGPNGVEIMDAPVRGAEVLLKLQEHVESHIERYIIGQTASSRSETSGLGTHDDSLQADTKNEILALDSEDFAETLTGSEDEPHLVSIALKYTCPWADFPVRWVFDDEEVSDEGKLEAISKAAGLGVTFVMDEVRSLTGMSKPADGDEVVGGQQTMGQGGGGEEGGEEPWNPFGGQDDGGGEDGGEPEGDRYERERPDLYERHKYGSTQFNLPRRTAARVLAMAAKIRDKDLADDGREDEPHLTVKYGLHGNDPDAVREAVAGFGPVRVRLGKTSLFHGDGFDVVKVGVEGKELRRLNRAIADACECTDTHPRYNPHVTLAYVKPGRGKRYAGDDTLDGVTVTLSRLVFSDREGNRTVIRLAESDGEVVLPYGRLDEILRYAPEDWLPHTITRGPRKGQQAFKHRKTGQILTEVPGAKRKAIQERAAQRRAALDEKRTARARAAEDYGSMRKGVADALGALRGGTLTADHVVSLANDLPKLKLADLLKLKKEFGVKPGSGRKARAAEAVAAWCLGRLASGVPLAKPGPKSSEEKPQKPAASGAGGPAPSAEKPTPALPQKTPPAPSTPGKAPAKPSGQKPHPVRALADALKGETGLTPVRELVEKTGLSPEELAPILDKLTPHVVILHRNDFPNPGGIGYSPTTKNVVIDGTPFMGVSLRNDDHGPLEKAAAEAEKAAPPEKPAPPAKKPAAKPEPAAPKAPPPSGEKAPESAGNKPAPEMPPSVGRAVGGYADTSKPLAERLRKLSGLDTQVVDALYNSPEGKAAGIDHNEFLRRIHASLAEYEQGIKREGDKKRLAGSLDEHEGRIRNKLIPALRKLAASGVKGSVAGQPIDLNAAADLYEQQGLAAVAEARKAAGLDAPRPTPSAPAKPEARPAPKPPEKPAASQAPADHGKALLDAVRAHGGRSNLADLADVRKALSAAGMTRAQQDAAILDMRKRGIVTASAYEGRHGITPEQREAAIREGDTQLGFLAVKDEAKLRAYLDEKTGTSSQPQLTGQPQLAKISPESPAPSGGNAVNKFKVFHGKGRASKDAAYLGGAGAVLGDDATYYAFDSQSAGRYGPEVTEHEVGISKPLNLTDDNEWKALTSAAGVPADLALVTSYGGDKSQVDAARKKLTDYVRSLGHDGVVVRMNQNRPTKRLGQIFGHDQLVALHPEGGAR